MPRIAKPVQPKNCETCAKPLTRKHNAAGRLEDYRSFTRRRFCSLSCANSRPKGGGSRKASHYQARKLRGPECECCGTTKRLHAHHVNEDWRDNRPENVQTLCIFCHQFWHATHRRLGVKPTARMPRLASLWATTPHPESAGSEPPETPSSRRKRQSSSPASSTSNSSE